MITPASAAAPLTHLPVPPWRTSKAHVLPCVCADSSEVLEHAAYLGMAAMLNGPMFTADVRNPEVGGRAGAGAPAA